MNDADAIDEEFRVRLRAEVFGIVVAVAFCAFGGFYYYSHLAGADGFVDKAFVWTLRLSAVGFAVCAPLAMLGHRLALLIDVAVCAVLAVVLAVTALAWLAESVFVEGFVLGLAAMLSGGVAVRSWSESLAWVQARARATPTSSAMQGTNPKPPVPWRAEPAQPEQSLRPPPEGGFLADLGREDD